jgi:hypothetical protein
MMKKAIKRGTRVNVRLNKGLAAATVLDFAYAGQCYDGFGPRVISGHYIYTIITTNGKTVRVSGECIQS